MEPVQPHQPASPPAVCVGFSFHPAGISLGSAEPLISHPPTTQHWRAWLHLLDALPTGRARLLRHRPGAVLHPSWTSPAPQASALTILVSSAGPSPVSQCLVWIRAPRRGGCTSLQTREWTEAGHLFPRSPGCAPLAAVPEPAARAHHWLSPSLSPGLTGN